MKNIKHLLLFLLFAYSCEGTADTSVNNADKMNTAQERLQNTGTAEENALKVQADKDWQNFRETSDSIVDKMDRDLTKFDSSFVKVNEMDFVYINYKDAKNDLRDLKNKLNSEDDNFGHNSNRTDDIALRNNVIFKENFKTEMAEVGASVKNLANFNK